LQDRGQNTQGSNASVVQPVGDGFITTKLAKGRITHRRTRAFKEFMFNPHEVRFSDGWEWGGGSIPGMPAPYVTGGVGIARTVDFTLYMDAERGRCHLRSRSYQNKGVGNDANLQLVGAAGDTSLDLTSDLNWFRMLTFPTAGRDVYAESAPSTVVLNLGPLFAGVECTVEGPINFVVTAFTPKLEPMRASAEIKLRRFFRKRVTTADFTMGASFQASPSGYDDGGQAG
jgi:hypothetical protein